MTETTGARRTVLYIEDNVSNMRLVERILARRSGVQLISAMQGWIGVDLAMRHRPDLVLLDLHLPDMPGTEVLHRLQAEPALRDTPVVMVSADAAPGQIERLRSLGAQDYITKPIDVGRFLAVIDSLLEGRGR